MSRSQYYANAIRALTMDAVEAARSGHPGAPMGMADIAQVLWTRYLKHNPSDPHWPDRDRFVLSNGHGSMLLYSLLHLTGYDLDINELKAFRQLGSRTPGHPEYDQTPGVETTTGPLGQGFANAVGMALAEKMLAAQFNREAGSERLDIVDHHTYVFLGDGCLMEGISHEVASLAGTLKLGKLICFYDDNGISIDGEVKGWFTDNTQQRFEAYDWHVIPHVDGHDPDEISKAIDLALANKDQPALICCKTRIGYGAPHKAGTASVHGSPLGEEEVQGAREQLQWPHPPFEIPEEIYAAWDCKEKGNNEQTGWQQAYSRYRKVYPDLADEFERRQARRLVPHWDKEMQKLLVERQEQGRSMASRSASGEVIAELARMLPELVGGSADLTGSNCTDWGQSIAVRSDYAAGNYINYGVREFGMTAMTSGMVLHGGFRPFSGTFLTFMDYARNAVRMSALMGLPNIFVYTHDSIGQGEDGPTHQPVEQLATLRNTPGLSVWRPCDAVETVAAWKAAIEKDDGSTALVLSRQNLVHQPRSVQQLEHIARGGYILWEPKGNPRLIIIATGSEVDLAVQACHQLGELGVGVRVVSMPSVDVFESQDPAYRQAVLPDALRKRIAIEAAHCDYWRKWVGLDGAVIGMNSYGLSAPGPEVFKRLGFTVDRVVTLAKSLL